MSGPSRATSWSAPARWKRRTRCLRRAVRRRQHRHRGRACDNSDTGAAWVYTRSGGVWTQQGASWSAPARLEAPDKAAPSRCPATATPPSWAGVGDNSDIGAAWVYTRSGTVWTQQGNKLVGTDAVGSARQGHSVALSADGNTAIVGGLTDNRVTGAAWVYTRSGGVWTRAPVQYLGY